MTSKMKTLVEVLHMDLISREASLDEVAIYLATEPNPGQLSVTARSLSMVLEQQSRLIHILDLLQLQQP